VFLAGYEHYLRAAAASQWDQATVDLHADAARWPRLPEGVRERVLGLLCGFCVGEDQVAGNLDAFTLAAHRPGVAACFRAQAVDEARHACFFDRAAAEVARLPGVSPRARRRAARARVTPSFVRLFDERLPAAAGRLAEENGSLGDGVALYHMLLEGIVFTAGVSALLDLLDTHQNPLPGLRRGVELVARDERWHVGFGARLLADLGLGAETVAGLLEQGRSVVAVWGDLVDPQIAAGALALHRRRLLTAQASTTQVAA